MFEARVHEILANSLGRILDISKEQLRISLWSGARRRAAAGCRALHLLAPPPLLPVVKARPGPFSPAARRPLAQPGARA